MLGFHEETKRPTWKGMVVPWVARWSGEVNDDDSVIMVSFGGHPFLTRQRDALAEPLLSREDAMALLQRDRDDMGLFWTAENDAPGVGEPEFAMVHSRRQRTAMRDGLCQVCGLGFDGEVTFLEHKSLFLDKGEPFTTVNAPVHRSCMKVVMRQCPAHRKRDANRVIVTAVEYVCAYVVADLYTPDGKDCAAAEHLAINDARVFHSISKQLGIGVLKYNQEPMTLDALG